MFGTNFVGFLQQYLHTAHSRVLPIEGNMSATEKMSPNSSQVRIKRLSRLESHTECVELDETAAESSTCSTMDEWIEAIKRLWITKMDDCKYLWKIVDSMPRRLEEVIERQGASTKY